MKAGRIHAFGPPNAIVIDEIPHPTPEEVELVIRVAAAGVGPWDALIREGKSVVQPSLPVILGSDFAGIVDSVGTGVSRFKPGDEVFGVTNKQFCETILWRLCRIRGGVGTNGSGKAEVVEFCGGGLCAGGRGDGVSDAVRPRADEGRTGGINPRCSWQCWSVCGATGEASRAAGFRCRWAR